MTTWTERPSHRHWLRTETLRLLDFGRGAMPTDRGAGWLDEDGAVDPVRPAFTWINARTAHVYALGHLLGVPGCRGLATRALHAQDPPRQRDHPNHPYPIFPAHHRMTGKSGGVLTTDPHS